MLISEVIEMLEDAKREYGDLPVWHYNDWTDFLVDDFYAEEAHLFTCDNDWVPERIVLMGETTHSYPVNAQMGQQLAFDFFPEDPYEAGIKYERRTLWGVPVQLRSAL